MRSPLRHLRDIRSCRDGLSHLADGMLLLVHRKKTPDTAFDLICHTPAQVLVEAGIAPPTANTASVNPCAYRGGEVANSSRTGAGRQKPISTQSSSSSQGSSDASVFSAMMNSLSSVRVGCTEAAGPVGMHPFSLAAILVCRRSRECRAAAAADRLRATGSHERLSAAARRYGRRRNISGN
jgi:hypothetical protein